MPMRGRTGGQALHWAGASLRRQALSISGSGGSRSGSATLVALTGLVVFGSVGITGTAAGASQGSQYAALKKALFVRSDFPSGWSGPGKVTTSNGGGSSIPGESQLAACVGLSQNLFNLHSPTATSPTFQDKGGTHYVQDNTNTFPSTTVAAKEYAAISGPKVPGCLTTVFGAPAAKQQLESSMNGTIGTVTVTAVNPALLVGHSAGFVIAFQATVQGIMAPVSITVVSMVRGKTGHQVSFTSVGTDFPASFEHHLVAIAYGRT
jgi:hypothetical protein